MITQTVHTITNPKTMPGLLLLIYAYYYRLDYCFLIRLLIIFSIYLFFLMITKLVVIRTY